MPTDPPDPDYYDGSQTSWDTSDPDGDVVQDVADTDGDGKVSWSEWAEQEAREAAETAARISDFAHGLSPLGALGVANPFTGNEPTPPNPLGLDPNTQLPGKKELDTMRVVGLVALVVGVGVVGRTQKWW